jgi:polysaccharide export outer membrane protein
MRYFCLLILAFAIHTSVLPKTLAQDKDAKALETAQKVAKDISQRNDERYHIGLHDVLEITVYKHPELSLGNIRLDETGKIRLPHPVNAAEIVAVCKTENQLAREIEESYKSYLRNPSVSVFVKEQNSQPLSVIGAVKKPGSFFTNRRLSLLELLTYAGGQDVEKSGTRIQVARVGEISGCSNDTASAKSDPDGIIFFAYNLNDVLTGRTNPMMHPGDIVVVLEVEQIYVTGNVVKPQAIPLKEKVTLTQAIAAAGGILPATDKRTVRILRQGTNGAEKKEMTFDLVAIKDRKVDDPELQANDIVEVPTDKVKDFRNNLVRALTGGVGNVFYRLPL